MDLETYISTECPEIYRQFKAWERIGFELEVGQWVVTTTHGFSGGPGRRCQFLGMDETFPQMGLFGYEGSEPRWGMKKLEFLSRLLPVGKE